MTTKGPGRCTGHCCKSFGLRFAPDELQKAAEESRKKKDGEFGKDKEAEKVAAMVLYLGQFNTNPLMKIVDEPWTLKGLRIAQRADMLAVTEDGYDYNGSHWYGCRHVLPNGDCGVYGDDTKRPKLCDVYPNGELCKFEECTMPLDMQVKQLSGNNVTSAVRELEKRKIIPPKALLRKRDEQMHHLMDIHHVKGMRTAEDLPAPAMKAKPIPVYERQPLAQKAVRGSMKIRVATRRA